MRRLALAPDEQLQSLGEASRKIAQERFDERLVLNAYLGAIDSGGTQYDDHISIAQDSLHVSQAAG